MSCFVLFAKVIIQAVLRSTFLAVNNMSIQLQLVCTEEEPHLILHRLCASTFLFLLHILISSESLSISYYGSCCFISNRHARRHCRCTPFNQYEKTERDQKHGIRLRGHYTICECRLGRLFRVFQMHIPYSAIGLREPRCRDHKRRFYQVSVAEPGRK